MTQAVRVVIADDHALFRAGLRKLLQAEPGFMVVGEAEDGVAAVRLVRTLAPDVLLLDFAMPAGTAMDVLREIASSRRTTRTVILTASISSEDTVAVLGRGAVGVLMKTAAEELLFECVRSVAAGQFWVGRETVGSLIEALAKTRARRQGRPFGLTGRELEVVRLVAASCSNREIGEQLRISEDTVKHHLRRAFDKTGTSSRVELAVFALNHHLEETEG